MRSGSGTGSGRRITWCTTVKSAVLAPRQRARVRATVKLKALSRDRSRSPTRTSRPIQSTRASFGGASHPRRRAARRQGSRILEYPLHRLPVAGQLYVALPPDGLPRPVPPTRTAPSQYVNDVRISWPASQGSRRGPGPRWGRRRQRPGRRPACGLVHARGPRSARPRGARRRVRPSGPRRSPRRPARRPPSSRRIRKYISSRPSSSCRLNQSQPTALGPSALVLHSWSNHASPSTAHVRRCGRVPPCACSPRSTTRCQARRSWGRGRGRHGPRAASSP